MCSQNGMRQETDATVRWDASLSRQILKLLTVQRSKICAMNAGTMCATIAANSSGGCHFHTRTSLHSFVCSVLALGTRAHESARCGPISIPGYVR